MNSNRTRLRETLQYLDYAAEVLGGLRGLDLTEGQKLLETSISHLKKVYGDLSESQKNDFRRRQEMSEAEATIDQNIRSKKRMVESARVACAVAREQLAEAQKTGNRAVIDEAQRKVEATIKRRVTAEKHETAAKSEAERGAI